MTVKGLIVDNFWLKIFSLVCGTAIYLMVHHSLQTTDEMRYEVVVSLHSSLEYGTFVDDKNRPMTFEIEQARYPGVVRITGPKTRVQELASKTQVVPLVIGRDSGEKFSGGKHTLKLEARDFEVPPDIRVDVINDTIDVNVREIVEQSLTVKSRVKFVSGNYEISHIPLQPLVKVRGPREVIDTMQHIETESLERTYIEGVQSNRIRVNLVSRVNGVPIRCTPSSVEMQIETKLKAKTKSVRLKVGVLTDQVNSFSQVLIEPNFVDVEITGPPKLPDGRDLMNDVRATESLRAFVDLRYYEGDNEETANDFNPQVLVQSDPDLREYQITVKPQTVKVTLTK